MSEPRPRVAMLVPNAFTADARAARTARTLAAAGLRVTVLASHRSGLPAREVAGGVEVVRVPVTKLSARWDERPRRFGVRYVSEAEQRVDTHHLRSSERDLAVEIARRRLALRQQPSDGVAGLVGLVRRKYLAVTVRALRRLVRLRRSLRRRREPVTPRAPRWGNPVYRDFEVAYGKVIDELRPDVIHAHNFPMMPIAARAATIARAAGRATSWIYDAHELVEGLSHLPDDQRAAARALEAEYIGDADAVVTVSPHLAERLRGAHRLDSPPAVVLNAPSRRPGEAPTVRDAAGVAPDVPLLVYSGNANEHRGVHTLVEALPELDGVHVAVVTRLDGSAGDPYLRRLVAIAEDAGCADRLHLTPLVQPDDVTAHLSGADAGVVPLVRYGNAEVALTNKLFEYLHAGLPVVVSDCAAQAEFVRRFGVGRVFAAEDPHELALAARAVLERRAEHTAALTDELLDAHSWEAQEHVLLDVYRGLLGDRMPEPAPGERPGIPR